MTDREPAAGRERHDVFPLFCGFCMGSEDETEVLVRGPIVCICDRCVEVIAETIAGRAALSSADTGGADHGE